MSDAPCCLRALRDSVVKTDSLENSLCWKDRTEPERVEVVLVSHLAAIRWRYDRANSLVWGLGLGVKEGNERPGDIGNLSVRQ